MHWIVVLVRDLLGETPVTIKHIHGQTSLDALTLAWACNTLVDRGMAQQDCVGRVSRC